MTTPRPHWMPATFAEAEADVAAGLVSESHYVELKELVESGQQSQQGTSKIRKALASLANDGGVFVIGVKENKQNGLAEAVTPVPLAGLAERVQQVARSFDPPLSLLEQIPLRRSEGDAEGILLVPVEASMWAPHQTPDGRYYGRNNLISYQMPDAEVERLIRLRYDTADRAGDLTAAAVARFRERMSNDRDPNVWITIVIEPIPLRRPELLMPAFEGDFTVWGRQQMIEASEVIGQVLERNPDRMRIIGAAFGNDGGLVASPHHSGGTWSRTDSGLACTMEQNSMGYVPKFARLEIDWSGTVRLAVNHLSFQVDQRTGLQRTVCHTDIGAAATWALGFYRAATGSVGAWLGANVGMHVGGLLGVMPNEMGMPESELREQRRQRHGFTAFTADTWTRATVLNFSELADDPFPAVYRLLGGFYSSLGIRAVTG